MKRTYSVRLDDADVALWDALAARWQRDRSDTFRRLLREHREKARAVPSVPVPQTRDPYDGLTPGQIAAKKAKEMSRIKR